MSRKPAHYRHRADTTAKALGAHAKSCGLWVLNLGGAVDAAWGVGEWVALVDYKSPGGELTPTQARLVAAGVPIHFVSTTEQVEALAAKMKREALR